MTMDNRLAAALDKRLSVLREAGMSKMELSFARMMMIHGLAIAMEITEESRVSLMVSAAHLMDEGSVH